MNPRDLLRGPFTRQLLATPAGRALVLAQIAEAEESGEARVFDDALARVDDPKLQKMIVRHREDELRHARLFRECLERTGVDPGPVPHELRVLDRIDAALGGFFQRPLENDLEVMQAYLILQAIEERAVEQFALYGPAFRPHDARTAAVFEEVIADERRHLAYCRAISRRYAPDEETLTRELARIRRLEAEAYWSVEGANMAWIQANGLIQGTLPRLVWRGLGRLRERRPTLPLTAFAHA